ncbi:MAG: 2-amino-4-hydroxy-6-hydroxymethyldihydropteridine diphosphokinase [Gracilibacteraceae bacterium]|jgi:2-amino-4-hydroxy-6-hydroxymethyldihydropteridine diphosphokinase|nr:2-amino-4-hydroxy-6-hydroxymethyldihydropteridine diphosphokinase [Gracilibacteraceae bacterium]
MPKTEITGYLSLGGNIEPREDYLRRAAAALDARPGLRVTRLSALYETAPWGGVPQADFLNMAAAVATTLTPEELLTACQETEALLGRDRARGERWGPREIDIDILLLGKLIRSAPELTIPHPRLTERAFVLVPLLEIAPGLKLPDGTPLTALTGRGAVRRYP